MLNLLSSIKIVDNTGALLVLLLKRLQPKTSTKHVLARVGSLITCVIRKVSKQDVVELKERHPALIVRTKSKSNFLNLFFHSSLSFIESLLKNFYSPFSFTHFIDFSIPSLSLKFRHFNQKLGGHTIF